MRGFNPLEKFNKLGKVTVPFGGKTDQEEVHPGVDVANSSGTPIHAPVDGVVVSVDDSHTGVDNSFVNTLKLKDSAGQTHEFHHLQATLARPGQQIRKGQPIAKMGATGAVYSPSGGDPSSLDFRIVDAFNRYVDPTPYVKYL